MIDRHIQIQNIYYMLSYAFQVLKQSNYKETASEQFDNIHNLFAAILSKGIAQQLKQGLHREYVNQTEDLAIMRGKLELNGTIRNRMRNRRQLTCEFDELSENNAFNQILKTTAVILTKEDSVKEEYKAALKRELQYFNGVETIDPFCIRWDALRFSRNNQSYRMLMALCQFVLEGLLLSETKGEYKLAQFLDEQHMSRLYEKFLLEFFSKEVPEVKAKACGIEWQKDEECAMLPAMKCDVMLTRGEKTLIIDAKYYSHTTQEQFGKHTLHSGNVYQIFAYVMNQDKDNTGKVAGILLYARTDEEIQADAEVTIMGHRISAKTLDLNRPFEEISRELKGIAQAYFEY